MSFKSLIIGHSRLRGIIEKESTPDMSDNTGELKHGRGARSPGPCTGAGLELRSCVEGVLSFDDDAEGATGRGRDGCLQNLA